MAQGGRLYMFLHGLIVCQDTGNEIVAVLPQIAGHVCKAGNWLRETTIGPNADLRLEGVKAGAKSVKSLDKTIVLAGCSLDRGPRAATLRLKQPNKVLQLLVTNTVIQTKASQPQTFPRVSTLLVFQYDFDDENKLYLGPNAPSPPGTG